MDILESLVEPEWLEWYRLTPQERWAESERLWVSYLAMGGSLDPEPDSQSPFYDPEAPCNVPADGGQACVFYGAAVHKPEAQAKDSTFSFACASGL